MHDTQQNFGQQSLSVASIDGGFSDPVFNAQAIFNLIMNAMARPGTVAPMTISADAPPPIMSSTAAIMLTLLDADTSFWTDATPDQASRDIEAWIGFHTGSKPAAHMSEADFVIITNPMKLPDLASFKQGSQEYPDRSTTLIVQLNFITSGDQLHLTGPGIRDMTSLSVAFLPPHFIEQWRANHQRFSRGVDVILVDHTQLACLPRTTFIAKG